MFKKTLVCYTQIGDKNAVGVIYFIESSNIWRTVYTYNFQLKFKVYVLI